MKKLTILCIALLSASSLSDLAPCRAAQESGSPEEVVSKALDAMSKDRPEDFARAMHPDALKQFRRAMTDAIDQASRKGQAGQFLRVFQGVNSADDLKKFDDAGFFTAFLRGTISLNPDAKRYLASTKNTIIGTVPEGKDTVHVVYRSKLTADGADLDRMKVTSLGRNGTGWGMLLDGDVEATAAMMKQSASGKFEMPDLSASKITTLGRVLEGDAAAQVVYRMTTPAGAAKIAKLGVLTVGKSDPGFAAAQENKTDQMTAMVRKKLGLK